MAKTKKTVAKKTTTKKPTAKKAVTRKPVAKPKAKATKGKQAVQLFTKAPAIRRPDPNLPPDIETVTGITENLLSLIQTLENYAA